MKYEDIRVGDKVIVTGDTAMVNHGFRADTEGVVGSLKHPLDVWAGRIVHVTTSTHEAFWVEVNDLEPAEPPATEQDIEAAIRSIKTRAP